MPPRVTAVQQSGDSIDDVEETGGPTPTSSTSSAAADAPAEPGTDSKLNPHAEVRKYKGTAYVNADPKAKDWTLFPSEDMAKQKGVAAVQSVATETVVYNNGQTATFILDGSGQRFPDAANTGRDDNQRKIWDEAVKDDKTATGPATRRAVRAYPGIDPKSGQPAIITEYDKGDPYVRAMTAGERKSWEDARESEWNADPKNNTDPNWSGRYETHAARDARKDREGKEAQAAGRQDDTTPVDETFTGLGQNRKKTTTFKSGRKLTVDAPTTAREVKTEFTADGTKVVTYDDNTTTSVAASPAEQRAAAAANAAKPEKDENGNWGYWTKDTPPKWVPIQGGPAGAAPKPVQVNGVWGVWKPDPNDPKAAPTFEAIANQPGGVKLPDDAPKLDLTDGTTAHTSYMALLTYVDQKVRSGEMTPEQGIAVLKIPEAQTNAVLAREKETLAQQNTAHDNASADVRDQETQRNNRAQMSSNMMANASARAGKPGELRGDLTPEYLQLQAQMNQASGANRDPNFDIAAIGIGRAGAPGAAGPKPGMGVDGMPLDGNEKPDDILTVRDNLAGDTKTLTRAEYEEQVKNYPWVKDTTTVLDAKPAGAPAGAAGAPAPPAAPTAGPVAPLLGPPPAVPGSATVVQPSAPGQAGDASAGWSAPQDEMDGGAPAGAAAPPAAPAGPVAAVGSYQGPTTAEERAKQMIAEGFSPQEVDEAMRRFLARHGAAA